MGWLRNVMVAIDQLGNSLAGGNPDLTISARVGYHASIGASHYWRLLERVIDFTFYPLDGPRHCIQSYRADVENYQDETGNDVARAILGVFALCGCAILCLPVRVIAQLNKAQGI